MPDIVEPPAFNADDKESEYGHELFVHPSTYLRPKEKLPRMALTPLDKEQMCGLVSLSLFTSHKSEAINDS